jgi:Cu2+-exporting ATPase
MIEDFKKRFWVSLVGTIPVLFLSPMIQSFLGFSLAFPGNEYILFGISAFLYFFGGWPFLKGLLDEFRKKKPGMMTLIALAITVAFGYSSLVVFGLRGKIFFWELVTLIDVMLLGHWIEMRSVMGASRALQELAKLLPSEAHLIAEDGSLKDVRMDELEKGNKVLVKPGEKVPVDGTIIKGESEIDQSMMTGESRLVEKSKGQDVIGGSVNGTGSLTVEVSKTGKDSYLSQVVDLVKQAGESKSRTQDFADRAAFWLTIIAISVGIVTLASWLILGKEFVFSLERMVTVMVVTCPHALGLAIPLVIAVITALSAQNGLLIRNRTSFETAFQLNTIVFDKTGTLTRGEFGVSEVVSVENWSRKKLLESAASIEKESEHSIAKAIVRKADEENLKLHDIENFEALPGKGAKAIIEGGEVFVGNKSMLQEVTGVTEKAKNEIENISSKGMTTVIVISGGKVQGVIGLSDLIRDESRSAIEDLKGMGFEIAMITGDNEPTAQFVAEKLGIDKYFAEVLPDEKSDKIKELQKNGKKVAMVGDGVNDAPALAQADLGIAIGAGTDVAVETADVVLVENDPEGVMDIISLSRLTRKKMKQNLAWATGYNIIAIPLAAGILYNQGIVLAPAVGALIMSFSTVIVAVNAKLVKYKR